MPAPAYACLLGAQMRWTISERFALQGPLRHVVLQLLASMGLQVEKNMCVGTITYVVVRDVHEQSNKLNAIHKCACSLIAQLLFMMPCHCFSPACRARPAARQLLKACISCLHCMHGCVHEISLE